MRDISARELKGHNILAVERFWDNTRWMIEFSVLRPSTAYGSPGDEMRLFLTEDGYQTALQSQQRREFRIGSTSTPVIQPVQIIGNQRVEGRIGRHTFFCAPVVREPEVKPGIF